MDVSFNNVLEGTRQYFLGLPKQAGQDEGGQPVWPAGAPPPEEGAPAQSGAPAPSSRPPSAAAASTAPPRPPSEPLEPEPHIIHKATVMREAAEKRRELKEPDDEEDASSALSPPTHIIHKPAPRSMMSPAPAPAAPSPSPARPPSAAPSLATPEPVPHPPAHYRSPAPTMHTPVPRPPENFAPGRPPDPYSVSRPPEHYSRYSYDPSIMDSSRRAHGSTPNSVQHAQTAPARASPQSYSRISSAVPQHSSSRLRDISASSTSSQQRYMLPAQPAPPPPHNDRVPPIHHPPRVQQQLQRAPVDSRTAQMYVTHHQRRDTSPYARPGPHYERHTAAPPRKYDHQQGYPGYRPTTLSPSQPPQPAPPPQRVETHQPYKRSTLEAVSTNYVPRPSERVSATQAYNADINRIPPRADYNSSTTSITPEGPSGYNYPSTSSSTLSSRIPHRPVATPKSNYEFSTTSHTPVVPLQSVRSSIKPALANQQARMTVSVTSLVNQMNQTKQKRESPLDLSVKTVKNSADSSTTQDDLVDSVSVDSKTLLQPRATSSTRHIPQPPGGAYVGSHKVDFAPDFNQYRDRNNSHNYPTTSQTSHLPVRYNGAYDVRRQGIENYPESRHPMYLERYKYNAQPGRPEHVPRIDLTKPEERHTESKIRDDRHFIIEERKRPGSQAVGNIPEKIVRYETWTADSRIDRLSQSAREQHELMSRPVYSYSSHKQFEAYQNEQKKALPANNYRELYPSANQRHPGSLYPTETPNSSDYNAHYQERITSSSSRHVIQKTPNQRDLQQHHYDHHNGIPADKRVLSLLRNSLETKQTGFSDPIRPPKQIPELIVIDDADDAVIEITDLTRDNDSEIRHKNLKLPSRPMVQSIDHHIRMPRAVDSIADTESPKLDSLDQKSKSPENDVASRIRTKAELKVMPPSSDHSHSADIKMDVNNSGPVKVLPKSQKQHLFNQIRQDNLRLESVIKHEIPSEVVVPEVKSEPLFLDEIEKDAALLLKTESALESIVPEETIDCKKVDMDLDWANTCDNFMEQLKTGSHKKKIRRRIETTEQENEDKMIKNDSNTLSLDRDEQSQSSPSILNIKQEPLDDYELNNKDEPLMNNQNNQDQFIPIPYADQKLENLNDHDMKSTNGESDIKIVSKKEEEAKEKVSKSEHVLKNKTKDKESKKLQTDINKNTKDKKTEHEKCKNKVLRKGSKNKRNEKSESPKSKSEVNHKKNKSKTEVNVKVKIEKSDTEASTSVPQVANIGVNENEKVKTVIKEELESTDDDEPLIKSKILKEKEKSDQLKYQLLKDLSEKSAYVKLECFEVDVNKNTRISVESLTKEKEEKPKGKSTRQSSRCKNKSLSRSTSDKIKIEKLDDSSSDSDDELTVTTRLRLRKSVKTEESKPAQVSKTPSKSMKKHETSSTCSTPARKPGFGDASYFHPGWEEELYRYKRSLRMPPRLIAIPRGGSGGPPTKGAGSLFNRGSTSLPDLDPAPLSPAPSSAPSAATDDFYTRRQEKLNIDSDVESNSSYSTPFKLQYDSEASTSTVFSTSKIKKKSSSIVDVLIQKCGKREEMFKKKNKEKEDKSAKVIPKNTSDLSPTPTTTPKTSNKENLTNKKENGKDGVFNLGVIKKEANTDSKDSKSKKTNTTCSKSKVENKTSRQRASISEVFGGNDKRTGADDDSPETEEEPLAKVKKDAESKCKLKKKLLKDKFKRKINPMRDGLRSCSLKRSDAKGRMLRFKKRNSLMQSLVTKRLKGIPISKPKTEKSPSPEDADKSKDDGTAETTDVNTKRRFKRLFGRRKFSSGFDYIRKKKKIIRKDEATNKIRRPVVKPTPESEHDIHKEIKGWFVNKSVGETHLHRAARLGYTDCVAYCLEKMEADPSAKDNAGFTPLHLASAKGYVRIAKLLLRYGANVSAAAQGGIRPLHEASENCHMEVIRLLLSYGADPLLGTYAGQTPEELAEGLSARFLRLHIADVQGKSIEPWRFPPPTKIIDYEELGCDPLSSPPPATPPPPPDATIEIQCTEAPLPPFYTLRNVPGQTTDGLWCLLQDVTNLLQIKSKDSLLKQIHCGSGSPKELFREIRTQEFLERAQCHQLLCAGEKVNVRASKVALVRVTDKLRQLLKIETVLVS